MLEVVVDLYKVEEQKDLVDLEGVVSVVVRTILTFLVMDRVILEEVEVLVDFLVQ
jgi:hypothetical protein